MTLDRIRIGFLPLVDAALPILARELGFGEAQGLEIELVRDMTWATVRDRLLRYGIADRIGPDRFFPTLGVAVAAYLGATGVDWRDWEERSGH